MKTKDYWITHIYNLTDNIPPTTRGSMKTKTKFALTSDLIGKPNKIKELAWSVFNKIFSD